MNERSNPWLYYAVAAVPALLVLAFWVVPKVLLQRFRRPANEDESSGIGKKLNTRVA